MDVREFFPGAPGSGLIRSGEERSTLAAQGQSGPSEEGDLMSVAFVPPVTQWRAAAAFSAAHVALMIAGLAISRGGALLEEGTQGITRAYVNADLTPILGGWLLESLAFLLLIPVVVFLAGAVGHTPAGRLVARTGLVSASIYVGITLAVGFPAGAAAAYGAQHGLDLETAAAFTSLRVFAYLLSLLCLGAHTLSLAICAMTDRFHRRWVGIIRLVAGAGPAGSDTADSGTTVRATIPVMFAPRMEVSS